MGLFYGKINAGLDTLGQLKEGFYESPARDKWFNGVQPGDFVFMIGGGKIQLWQALEFVQVMKPDGTNGPVRLKFEKLIENLGIMTSELAALKFFKVTYQMLVFTVRSTGRAEKAFFPLELVTDFPDSMVRNPQTYKDAGNFRKIVYRPEPGPDTPTVDIRIYLGPDGKITLHQDSFLDDKIRLYFTDNLDMIGKGQPNKDKTLAAFSDLQKAKSFSPKQMSLLRMYDAFVCTYREAPFEPDKEENTDIELDPSQDNVLKVAEEMQILFKLLKSKKQIILQGSAGVGKTYTTKELALRILGETQLASRQTITRKYADAVQKKRIAFCTFHQSMDYEDFVEGYKPVPNPKGAPSFELRSGVFKTICQWCSDDPKRDSRVLIIDEINRGNVSKIFGELITLLETDKRETPQGGTGETISARLTYSQQDFVVPFNLYIIGTMNTTDRSLGQIDYALRRRFAFYTIQANREALESYYTGQDAALGKTALKAFDAVLGFFSEDQNLNHDFLKEDIMIGHSYFMADSLEELTFKFRFELLPILEEYRKDGVLLCEKEPFLALLDQLLG